ncbi:MAG: hypothetical protein JWR69_4587 [Pedosphaera sp.]|nr:hypothetical protein [Pedosphaera sp.]
MLRSLKFIILFAWLAVAATGVVIAHLGLGFGWSISIGVAAIALAAVFLNGWLATWEDEQPGGFHNPKPEQKQKDSRHE